MLQYIVPLISFLFLLIGSICLTYSSDEIDLPTGRFERWVNVKLLISGLIFICIGIAGVITSKNVGWL